MEDHEYAGARCCANKVDAWYFGRARGEKLGFNRGFRFGLIAGALAVLGGIALVECIW